MVVTSRAPGKLVLVGEYAVLEGAPALVMAVDRHVSATIAESDAAQCRLVMRTSSEFVVEFAMGESTTSELIDAAIEAGPKPAWRAWRGELDSSALFAGSNKLGLGSSAAALVAWCGAWWRAVSLSATLPSVESLIQLHRAFQGGSGSGLDVAAARLGGVIQYRLNEANEPQISSVQLPNSVGFAGIFAGRSASTPNLIGQYRQWTLDRPRQANELRAAMSEIAQSACAAAYSGDGAGLVLAMAEYGDCLRSLGDAMGADLVTSEHREIGQMALRYGVTYKISGAGGGDLGVAACLNLEALESFSTAILGAGYRVIALPVAPVGLVTEEHA
jgi:phosphomevalonate kinase